MLTSSSYLKHLKLAGNGIVWLFLFPFTFCTGLAGKIQASFSGASCRLQCSASWSSYRFTTVSKSVWSSRFHFEQSKNPLPTIAWYVQQTIPIIVSSWWGWTVHIATWQIAGVAVTHQTTGHAKRQLDTKSCTWPESNMGRASFGHIRARRPCAGTKLTHSFHCCVQQVFFTFFIWG